MTHQLSSDDITRLCQELVYQVAYAFYDAPYIIILKLLVQDNVMTEFGLANKVGLSTGEVRKYMGTLHLHRLVRRHVNKEKVQMPEWRQRQLAQQQQQSHVQQIKQGQASSSSNGLGAGAGGRVMENRTRDVIYWYLDYREFANVVKYRLAMMRKGIDEKIKQEVGHRGYICPLDGKTFDPLDLSPLFDPFSNTFKCDQCQSELIEHDPTLYNNSAQDGLASGAGSGSKDAMQRFNLATAPIRDALKAVEGVMVPSVNIVAWIAVNVKSSAAVEGAEGSEEGTKKFEVVIGEDDGEEEKEKLAKAQREQNALPIWHTHSTVTGSATTLGIEDQRRRQAAEDRARRPSLEKQNTDDALALHYQTLDGMDDGDGDDGADADGDQGGVEGGNEVKPGVTFNLDLQDDDDNDDEGDGDEDEGMEDVTPVPVPVVSSGEDAAKGKTTTRGKMVVVQGQPKALEDITEDDEGLMSPEEYEAYAQAMYG